MNDDLLALLVISILVALAVVVVTSAVDTTQCVNVADILGIEYKWTLSTGCMLKIGDGRWIPLDSYKYVVTGEPCVEK